MGNYWLQSSSSWGSGNNKGEALLKSPTKPKARMKYREKPTHMRAVNLIWKN